MTTPEASLRRRVERLEAELRRMRQQLTSFQAGRGPEVRDSFLAKTCTDEAGEYPTTGDAVPISIFLDPKFTGGVDTSNGETHPTGNSPYKAVMVGGVIPGEGSIITVHSDRRGGFWAQLGTGEELSVVVDVYSTGDSLVQVLKKITVPVGSEIVTEEIIQFYDCDGSSSSGSGSGSGSGGGGVEEEAYRIAANYSKNLRQQTIAWSFPTSWYTGGGGGGWSMDLEYKATTGWKNFPTSAYTTDWVSNDVNGGGLNVNDDVNSWQGLTIDGADASFPTDREVSTILKLRVVMSGATGNLVLPESPAYTDSTGPLPNLSGWDIDMPTGIPDDWSGGATCGDYHTSDPEYCG